MDAVKLEQSILQEAIQGKLVPQLAEEGVAEQYGDVPEDVPFEVPDSWAWIRLEKLLAKRKTINPEDIENDTVELWSIPAYDLNKPEIISGKEIGSSKKQVFTGDVLLSKIVPHISRVWAVKSVHEDYKKLASTEWIVYKPDGFDVEYFTLVLKSYWFRNIMLSNVSGMGSLRRTNPSAINKTLLPVPPIKEQERIVKKLKEIFPLVEAYGKAHDKLAELNESLPHKLKQSILQEAIQGKLVPQLEEEGVVEQLGEEPEEVPFKIPESWKWVQLGDLLDMHSGKFLSANKIKNSGPFPCYGGYGIRGFTDTFNASGDSIIIGRVGALCGNIHVDKGNVYITDNAIVAECPPFCVSKCIGFFLEQMNLNQYSTTTAQPFVSAKRLATLPFPLPPFGEQERIAKKLDELLAQVASLKI